MGRLMACQPCSEPRPTNQGDELRKLGLHDAIEVLGDSDARLKCEMDGVVD